MHDPTLDHAEPLGIQGPVVFRTEGWRPDGQERRQIIIRVPTGEARVQSLFGDSYWGESRQPGTPIDMTDVPSETGILIYRVLPGAGDAAGHIDLEKNNDCRHNCHSEFAVSSYQIALWKLP